MIQVRNLHCGYPERRVLHGVSFAVSPGEFLGILGPNGSGKTTLLLALSGIVPIASGEVAFNGKALASLKPRERALTMAAVAQDSQVRFPFSCREIVRMGRYPHQKRFQGDSVEDERVVERAFRITDSEELAERLIMSISGGEKQRVVMARALAQETPILLLDEATSAMDINRKLQIFRVLEALNREQNLTILTVLHDVNLAALFCRRLIFLKEGLLVADGPTDEVLTSQVVQEVYDTEVLVQDVARTGKKQVVFIP